MILIVFYRKVFQKTGRVECRIAGVIDGESVDVGMLQFPSKQSWAKFYGAVQRGSINVTDLEVRIENVPETTVEDCGVGDIPSEESK